MVALRAEKQRELNDELYRQPQAASAGRRQRLDCNASGKTADRPEKRGGGAKPRTTEIHRARTVGASAELVGVGSGMTIPCRSGSPTNP